MKTLVFVPAWASLGEHEDERKVSVFLPYDDGEEVCLSVSKKNIRVRKEIKPDQFIQCLLEMEIVEIVDDKIILSFPICSSVTDPPCDILVPIQFVRGG